MEQLNLHTLTKDSGYKHMIGRFIVSFKIIL